MFQQGRILIEQALQGQRVGDLAALDQFAGRLINASVQRVGEMNRPQELVDLVEDQIVGKEGAEKGHLRLVVVRRDAGCDFAGLAQRAHVVVACVLCFHHRTLDQRKGDADKSSCGLSA